MSYIFPVSLAFKQPPRNSRASYLVIIRPKGVMPRGTNSRSTRRTRRTRRRLMHRKVLWLLSWRRVRRVRRVFLCKRGSSGWWSAWYHDIACLIVIEPHYLVVGGRVRAICYKRASMPLWLVWRDPSRDLNLEMPSISASTAGNSIVAVFSSFQ